MNELRKILNESISGENAVIHTEVITQFYRTAGSTGIRQAVEYCREKLENEKLDEIKIETYPVDGTTNLLGRISYPAWQPNDVVLRIVEPASEEIINYTDAPTCIMWFSTPTPPNGVIAEVVDIGSGINTEDYEGKDVKGKIVLASGGGLNPGVRIYELAVERFGAIGVITDYLLGEIPGIRTRETTPEFVGLLRQPRTFNRGWSIVISGIQGKRIRELLANGPVKLWAKVDTIVTKGIGENLIATIRGSEEPSEDVIIVGHTSATKPGGNCASGPALMIEMASILTKLIDEGKLPRPKRSIKFLFVCEGLGSNAYLMQNWIERKDTIGSLCLCGVGEDQDKCKSSLMFSRTPDSVPSFINKLVSRIHSEVSSNTILSSGSMSFGVEPYSPFSDNTSFNLAGVPCVLLHSAPNKYFHTQFMTADKMDPEMFKATGLIISETAYLLANAGLGEAKQWAQEIKETSEMRLDHLSNQFDALGDELNQTFVCSQLEYELERDMMTIDSVHDLVRDTEQQNTLTQFTESLKTQLKEKYELSIRKYTNRNPDAKHEPIINDVWKPKKIEKVFPPGHYYPNLAIKYEEWVEMGLEMKEIDDSFQQGKIRSIIHEIYNYSDGRHTISEIIEKIGFEYGLKLEPSNFNSIIKALIKFGSIEKE